MYTVACVGNQRMSINDTDNQYATCILSNQNETALLNCNQVICVRRQLRLIDLS